MGFLDVVRQINWRTVWNIVIAFIPYVDAEILGIIPVLREILPVTPIRVLELSWTERGRLLVLIVIPIVDGEILELLGVDIRDVIAD